MAVMAVGGVAFPIVKRSEDDDRNAAWSYETVGPFRFDRAAYEAALRTQVAGSSLADHLI
jgi:hypothetical protein